MITRGGGDAERLETLPPRLLPGAGTNGEAEKEAEVEARDAVFAREGTAMGDDEGGASGKIPGERREALKPPAGMGKDPVGFGEGEWEWTWESEGRRAGEDDLPPTPLDVSLLLRCLYGP